MLQTLKSRFDRAESLSPAPEAMRPMKPASKTQLAAIQRACRYIEARVADEIESEEAAGPITLAELGRQCGLSPWHLQRLFKQATGVSPRAYADAQRMKKLKAGLKRGEGVAEATYGAGFGSSSRVYERAGRGLGMTPASYAKGGRGAEIAYASALSPLGRLLVAATPKGVCFVSIGKVETDLVAALTAEFPAAEAIRRDRHSLAPALDAILAHLAGKSPHIELPLDIRATAFQRRVWQELTRIPAGETRSYSAIARRLGLPGGARAVGNACAANPVALVVPCHRALRESGELGGYRWGKAVKRKLLAEESARADIPRK